MTDGMGPDKAYREGVAELRRALGRGREDAREDAFLRVARRHFQREGLTRRPRRGAWLGASLAATAALALFALARPAMLPPPGIAPAVPQVTPPTAPTAPIVPMAAPVIAIAPSSDSPASSVFLATSSCDLPEPAEAPAARETGGLRIRQLDRAVAGADLGVNDAVPSQTSVVTDGGGRARMEDPQTAALSLRENSRLKVERWTGDVAVLRLEQGALRSKVQPRTRNQRYEVRTPYAVIKVVGTDFEVAHDPGHATRVVGFEGLVTVETLDGRLLGRVGAGETLRIAAPQVIAERERRRSERHRGLVAEASSGIEMGDGDEMESELETESEAEGTLGGEAPRGPAALLREARGMLAEGRDGEALALLEAHADESWRLRAMLGDAYRVSGDGEQALRAYEEAIAAAGEPAPASLLGDHASLLAKQGDAAAGEAWERYLEAYPEGRLAAPAQWWLAGAELRAGEGESAARRMRRILAAFPSAPQASPALARLGRLLLDDRSWDEAEELFSTYLNSPREAQAETALVGLLRVRVAQRRFPEARILIARYRDRFHDGRRADEVAHLESALP